MSKSLLLTVRFHQGYYYASGSWPPDPWRVFQALVAGAARGSTLPRDYQVALEWLENCDPPTIAAPRARQGQAFTSFVPNNDLDAVGGDLLRTAEIRTSKNVRPHLFDPEIPLMYHWQIAEGEEENATKVTDLASELYQLGRGVDMAWADAEILDAEEAETRLEIYGGVILRAGRGSNRLFACPVSGSLSSLIARHEASRSQLRDHRRGRSGGIHFHRPPKSRFTQVNYGSSATRYLFELRESSSSRRFFPWPLNHTRDLATRVRDFATLRMTSSLSKSHATIDRVFVGKDATSADKDQRIRIIPLPSIGHPQAESSIRRVLIEIPPNCPLPQEDVAWAFNGLHLGADPETGEIVDDGMPLLVEADEWKMPGHYGIANPESESVEAYRVWRTVTPAVLPQEYARRRIDPSRATEEAKTASERLAEEGRAAHAVRQALRHVGVTTPIEAIRVQREPFKARGERVESFVTGTRFSKHRVWHVEITFTEPTRGPLVIGDGRYLGLGLMAPEKEAYRDAVVFQTASEIRESARVEVLEYLRRALMAIDRDINTQDKPSRLFSGHEPDGAAARSGHHEHVFLAAGLCANDKALERIYVLRPDRVDRSVSATREMKIRFERVVGHLREVRCGRYGVIRLIPMADITSDHVLGTSRRWTSLTQYRTTRHPKGSVEILNHIEEDVLAECRRRGLPKPKVTITQSQRGRRGSISASLMLDFSIAITGPILLGAGSHKGQGLFVPRDSEPQDQ